MNFNHNISYFNFHLIKFNLNFFYQIINNFVAFFTKDLLFIKSFLYHYLFYQLSEIILKLYFEDFYIHSCSYYEILHIN